MDPVVVLILVAILFTVLLVAMRRIDLGVALLIVFAAITVWLIAGSPRLR